MKITAFCLFILLTVATACCQYVGSANEPKLKHHAPGDPSRNKPNIDTLSRQSIPNLLPSDVPNRFDPNVFELREQNHDLSITDLQKRVGNLEQTSAWLKGGAAGILLSFGLLLGFVRIFWKGIVILLLKEVRPDIAVTTSSASQP